VEAIRALLEAGADVNHADAYGRTPLADCAAWNDADAPEVVIAEQKWSRTIGKWFLMLAAASYLLLWVEDALSTNSVRRAVSDNV
jgi:ankyrin repeat protein